MSRLSGAVAYLAGPIDNASDNGVIWRQRVMDALVPAGITFINPTRKLWDANYQVAEEKATFQSLKREGKFREVKKLSHVLRKECLRCVDLSDFLIAYIDTSIHMCGTYEEVLRTSQQGKPLFAVFPQGRTEAPNWLFDVVDEEYMFDNLEDMIERVEDIAYSRAFLDDRWLLIRDHI